MDYVTKNPQDYFVASVKQGMEQLQNEQVAFFTDDIVMKGEYEKSPNLFQGVKTFPIRGNLFTSIPLTKNSPLKPLLKFAIDQYFERGHFIKSVGEKVQYASGSLTDTMVLKAGQVILILVVMVFGVMLTLAVFVSELAFNRITRTSTKSMQSKYSKQGIF